LFLTNRRFEFFGVLAVLAVSLAGCDSIKSIAEYFKEPSKEQPVVPEKKAVAAPAAEVQPAPADSVPMAANILARVGNWSITAEEFKERLVALKEVIPDYDITNPQAKAMVLDELINQQILVLGAEKSGLAHQKDIQAAIDEFRRTLIVREVAQQLTGNITVSEEEARTFYDENKDALVGPSQWHVREIVFSTKEEATSILGEILNGADFAEMARQHSSGKTAAEGGDLGFITQEPFPQMGSALLSLEVGDVSGVFKGPEGHYIVKLEEKKGGEQLSFEEVKEDIIQSQTLFKQQQVILDHLNRLKSEIKVEVNEQLL
jgi:peptidyl-prolyl cis-trans isomerase C